MVVDAPQFDHGTRRIPWRDDELERDVRAMSRRWVVLWRLLTTGSGNIPMLLRVDDIAS